MGYWCLLLQKTTPVYLLVLLVTVHSLFIAHHVLKLKLLQI